MSNKGFLAVFRLLAASGFREQDIADFLREVEHMGVGAAMDEIVWIRRQKPDYLLDLPRSSHGRQHTYASVLESHETVSKVERLLIEEARLPRQVAIALLTEQVMMRYPKVNVPSESRKGFSLWLSKLAALIPERELLSLATELRNQYVHSSPGDWKLR